MSSPRTDRSITTAVWGLSEPGSSCEVIAALRGSPIVTLRGYAKPQSPPTFPRPGGEFASSSTTAEHLQVSIDSRSRILRAIRCLTLTLAHVLAGSLGALVIFVTTQHAPAELIWRVLRVEEGAVLLQIGDAEHARTLSVPVGAALPDGQILTFVDAAQSMYAAGTSRVFFGLEDKR